MAKASLVRAAKTTKTTKISTKAEAAMTPSDPGVRIDIGISEKDRAHIAVALSHMLADSYTLYLMTHNFHWNVTGPQFNTLHQMFMTQYTEQWQALDDIAERIRALGHYAPGTYGQYAQLSSITEPTSVPDATTMVQSLVQGNEAVAKTARDALAKAEKAADAPTADLMTQRLDVHEKNAWMLRSLLQ